MMAGSTCGSLPPQYQAVCYRFRHQKVPQAALDAEKKPKVVLKSTGKAKVGGKAKTGGKIKVHLSWNSLKNKLGSAWQNVRQTLAKGGKAVSNWWNDVKMKMQIKGKKAEAWWKKEQARIQMGLKLKGKEAESFWKQLKSEFKGYIKKCSAKAKKTVKVKLGKAVKGTV